jgi:hypothetical protein
MKPRTINVEAFKLMDNPDIANRVKELSVPIVLKVRKTRDEFVDLGEALTFHDPGKMYDEFGNPLEPREMEFAERMSIEGHEFTEDFLNSKDKDGNKSKVACGYTKKFKHTDRHKWYVTYGKLMGFISDDPPALDLSKLSINIAFVDASGQRVDPKTIKVESHEERAPLTQPQVSFVR